jgi:hypothetical protein
MVQPEIGTLFLQNATAPVVFSALGLVLENPREAILFSCQIVPISAAGLQGEQPLVDRIM